jgi:undecaprenyl-phosphate 4-deoxy-4-formamido-L-arabinose transferase
MISVVIPVYNEEANLERLMERLEKSLAALSSPQDYEIILVDDGSRDRSLEILQELGRSRPRVRVVEMVRNYGQHAAVFAGFEQARGEIIVTLDADLQNPPEEIPRLVRVMEEGDWEVVGTVREERQDSILRRLPSRLINAVTRKMTKVNLSDWGCMLRAYRRPVVQAMLACQEHSTFIPALATIFAKRVTEIPVEHAEREAGQSHYNLWKLFRLQFDLVTSFSDYPLQFLLYLGLILAGLGIAFGVLLAALRLYFGSGWAAEGVFTLFAILFFLVGAQFFALGLIGEYIGRIYREVRKRPRYLVRRVYGEEKRV